MCDDGVNRAYLIFLRSILRIVTRVNLNFQAENANPFQLWEDLCLLYMKILEKITVPAQFAAVKISNVQNFEFQRYLRSPETMDVSWEFNSCFTTFHIAQETRLPIVERCRDFMVELAEQIRDRLPANMDLLESLRSFEPHVALSVSLPNIRPILYHFPNVEIDHESAASEYVILRKLDWTTGALKDPALFWSEVLQRRDDRSGQVNNISTFALALLCLPFSNASVERVFSMMSVVKTRLRNRMQTKMVDAILCTRYGFMRKEQSCTTFDVTSVMLQRFNLSMYQDLVDEDGSVDVNLAFNVLAEADAE